MSINSIHSHKLTMKKIATLTIVLSFLGVFQGVLAVSSARTHESPPNRIARQIIGSGSNYRNSANYDPYSMYIRNKRGEKESLTSNSLVAEDVAGGKSNDYYDPFFFYPSYARAGNGVRSRRNSHTQPYLRSASNQREVAYLYDRNSNVDNNNIFANQPSNQRLYNYRNPNTFLTKQQVTGVPTRNAPVLARYYFPQSNSIDYRKPNYYDQGRGYYRGDRGNYESARQPSATSAGVAGVAGGPEEAWSIQVGTQLKVQDDGRERNPEQFYVRDEQRSSNYNRRYPTYYRK